MKTDHRQRLESTCNDLQFESRNLQNCLEMLTAALNELDTLRIDRQQNDEDDAATVKSRFELDEKEAGLRDSIVEILERCEMEAEDFLKFLVRDVQDALGEVRRSMSR